MNETPQTTINDKPTNHIFFEYEKDNILSVLIDDVGVEELHSADYISFRWGDEYNYTTWDYIYVKPIEDQNGSVSLKIVASVKSITEIRDLKK